MVLYQQNTTTEFLGFYLHYVKQLIDEDNSLAEYKKMALCIDLLTKFHHHSYTCTYQISPWWFWAPSKLNEKQLKHKDGSICFEMEMKMHFGRFVILRGV